MYFTLPETDKKVFLDFAFPSGLSYSDNLVMGKFTLIVCVDGEMKSFEIDLKSFKKFNQSYKGIDKSGHGGIGYTEYIMQSYELKEDIQAIMTFYTGRFDGMPVSSALFTNENHIKMAMRLLRLGMMASYQFNNFLSAYFGTRFLWFLERYL